MVCAARDEDSLFSFAKPTLASSYQGSPLPVQPGMIVPSRVFQREEIAAEVGVIIEIIVRFDAESVQPDNFCAHRNRRFQKTLLVGDSNVRDFRFRWCPILQIVGQFNDNDGIRFIFPTEREVEIFIIKTTPEYSLGDPHQKRSVGGGRNAQSDFFSELPS